jgi:hypothetical protein
MFIYSLSLTYGAVNCLKPIGGVCKIDPTALAFKSYSGLSANNIVVSVPIKHFFFVDDKVAK